jgi:hypothetical protein
MLNNSISFTDLCVVTILFQKPDDHSVVYYDLEYDITMMLTQDPNTGGHTDEVFSRRTIIDLSIRNREDRTVMDIVTGYTIEKEQWRSGNGVVHYIWKVPTEIPKPKTIQSSDQHTFIASTTADDEKPYRLVYRATYERLQSGQTQTIEGSSPFFSIQQSGRQPGAAPSVRPFRPIVGTLLLSTVYLIQ